VPLRLLEIYLPLGAREDFHRILEGKDPIALWQQEVPDHRLLFRVIVPSENVEPLLDALQKRFSSVDGFRVIVLAVEASVPRPAADEETEKVGEQAKPLPRGFLRRVSREEIRSAVEEGAGFSTTSIVLVLLSTLVVVIGLLTDSAAVVIGGMVIAPLLGPNVALSFATTLGDLMLARRALRSLATGIALALGLSLLIGRLVPVDSSIPELALRTRIGIGEIVLALAVGCAGTLSFTTKLPSAVIGVMVAVALLPPLAAFGLLLGSGQAGLALRSLLLVFVNLIGINLAGVVTFFSQGIRPLRWWEAERAGRAMRIAIALWTVLLLCLSTIVFFTQT
jgi:uncharacterized hydrophobic protein (TIGR00341 family)